MRICPLLCAVLVAAVLAAPPSWGQGCSDGNQCTGPDMCSDGTCTGTPIAGECDDGNPCTINDTCISGVCQGTPAMGGTCGMAGCEGTCGPNGICLPDPEKQGQPCTDGLGECTTNDVCLGTFCFGELKECPDADGNKCTLDVCNIATGECMTLGVPPCGECETCNEQGQCVPANDGAACDDFNTCTGSGTCQEGICQAGAPIGEDTPVTPVATPTATPTDTEAPVTPSAPTSTSTPTPTITNTVTPGAPTVTDSPTIAPTTTEAPTETATIEAATSTPTGVPTGTATATPTGIPTGTATATATFTPTGIPTGTATATATFTPTGMPTGTATATATATGIPTGTATATATGTPAGTATATVTATPTGGGATATATATRTNTPTLVIPATSTATATHTPLPVMASIIVGNATGEPGATTSFDVSLETDASIAGVQVDIAYDPAAAIAAREDGKPDCSVNAEIGKDDTTFGFLPSGCTPGTDCTAVRAIVLSLDNLDPIPSGSRLFTCTVAIAADATGAYPLTCSNAGAGNTDGDRVGADCTSGEVTVAVPTDATIVIDDVVGTAGQSATMTVRLITAVDVAGTQNDTIFPAGVGVIADNRGRPTCSVNPEIDKGGTSFAFLPNGCTPGTDCTGVRSLVLALDNVSPIPSGSVLYTCEVSIASSVADGTYPLGCENAGASDPDGNAVATACDAGNVIVGVQPTVTSTPRPSNTPTETPTATPEGVPTATNTPAAPPTATATRTRGPKKDEDDGCQVVAPATGGEAWLLLLPVAALLWRRRR
jgi:hypothetical protein